MSTTISKSVTELNVGDVVVGFYGADFEIISQGCASDSTMFYHGHEGASEIAIPVGKWLRGKEMPHYFGKDLNWTFQGNAHHRVNVLNKTA